MMGAHSVRNRSFPTVRPHPRLNSISFRERNKAPSPVLRDDPERTLISPSAKKMITEYGMSEKFNDEREQTLNQFQQFLGDFLEGVPIAFQQL